MRDIFDDFGKLIKYYRIKRGMSLSDLSQKTKISLSYISRLENGSRHTPSFRHACIFIKELEIPMEIIWGPLRVVKEDLELSELFLKSQYKINNHYLTQDEKLSILNIIESVDTFKWSDTSKIVDIVHLAELVGEYKHLQQFTN